MRPVLAFEADAAVLFVPEVANSRLAYKEAARIPLTGDAGRSADGGTRRDRSAVARRGRRAGRIPREIVVALPASQVLRKTITLPAAVEDNLAQVLAYDLDRHTPFKPDEVCFDASIVGRDPVKKELRVDWAAALKTVVEQIAAARGKLGRGGGRRHARPPERRRRRGHGAQPPSRWPSDRKPPSRRRWEIWAPLALIAAAALFATALPVVAEARLRHRAHAAGEPGARAGRRVECAARAARAAHRRLQLRAVEEIRVSERAAIGRGRDEAPSRRHLADAARGEEHGERQGAEARDRRPRRKRQRRPPHLAVRGIEAVQRGRAALADDQDPARPRRNLRPRRATEALAAAAARAARRRRGCRTRAAAAAPAAAPRRSARVAARVAATPAPPPTPAPTRHVSAARCAAPPATGSRTRQGRRPPAAPEAAAPATTGAPCPAA